VSLTPQLKAALCLAAAIATSSNAEEVKSWRDDKGQMHYSNTKTEAKLEDGIKLNGRKTTQIEGPAVQEDRAKPTCKPPRSAPSASSTEGEPLRPPHPTECL
jgi:hypothetical protein